MDAEKVAVKLAGQIIGPEGDTWRSKLAAEIAEKLAQDKSLMRDLAAKIVAATPKPAEVHKWAGN